MVSTGFGLLRYLGTRDPRSRPQTLGFEEVLLGGLADHGGLYVPERVPELDASFLRGLSLIHI